ncbi:hypothetical protein [Luteococcus sp. OSA5]
MAKVEWTDRYGEKTTETYAFEVVEERPQQNFRLQTFGDDAIW